MRKEIKEFLQGFLIAGIADFVSMKIIFDATLSNALESVLLTAAIGGVLDWSLHKFKIIDGRVL